MDIVLTINGNHTLKNIIITGLTCAGLVSQATFSWGMVVMFIV
jgi:hypothetical protein